MQNLRQSTYLKHACSVIQCSEDVGCVLLRRVDYRLLDVLVYWSFYRTHEAGAHIDTLTAYFRVTDVLATIYHRTYPMQERPPSLGHQRSHQTQYMGSRALERRVLEELCQA